MQNQCIKYRLIWRQKIKKTIQSLGLSQDVCGYSHMVLVNGNTSWNIHCSFCKQGHMVTNCPRCECFKINAYEYCLTTSNEQDMDNLRDRIRSTNCISNHDKPPLHLIYGTLPSYLNSRNFILHLICLMDGKSQDTIETRLYCITFLLIDEYKDCNWNRIWVMVRL